MTMISPDGISTDLFFNNSLILPNYQTPSVVHLAVAYKFVRCCVSTAERSLTKSSMCQDYSSLVGTPSVKVVAIACTLIIEYNVPSATPLLSSSRYRYCLKISL